MFVKMYVDSQHKRMDFDAPKPNYDFQLEWMKYYKWTSPVKHDKYKAYCAVCKRSLNISRNGHFSLLQHEKTKIHVRNLSKNNEEYQGGANNCASSQSEATPVECPDNRTGINCDKFVRKAIVNDLSSEKTVNPRNPQAPFSITNTNESADLVVMARDISILHQTNLPNCNSTVDERSSSLQNTSETLDSVRNTCESNNGSISDLPESNGCSENDSNNATKKSSPELLEITASRATISPPNREQLACSVHKDHNLSDVSVILEPLQNGTKMDKPSNHLSTPGPSKGMEQTVKDEIKLEIDDDYPSVSSLPTATEQALEIDSNHLNSPSTPTSMNATNRNAEKTLEIPEAGDTESFNRKRSRGEENDISLRLSAHTSIYRSEIEESLPKKICLRTRELPICSHSNTKGKFLLNELRSIVKRLDEAKLIYDNKCRTIMEDYKILLDKFSEQSDPTFVLPEDVSSWNNLKFLRMLFNEANSSENLYPQNQQNNINGQHDNDSNSNENLSASQGFNSNPGLPQNG